MSIDAVRDSKEVSELWVQDRLERKHSWSELRALTTQLERLLGPGVLEKCLLPKNVHVMRVSAGQERKIFSDCAALVDVQSQEITRVLPDDFVPSSDCMLISHVLDRGSTGAAAMGFALEKAHLTWIVAWGTFHDTWNVIKNALKHSSGGVCWRAVLRLSAIANVGFGPYRSGAWRCLMSETLKRLTEELGPGSLRFQDAADLQAQLEPNRFPGPMEYSKWWAVFNRLPPCTGGQAPILKLSRWMSISTTWRFFRRELFLLQLVYEDMAKQDEGPLGDPGDNFIVGC